MRYLIIFIKYYDRYGNGKRFYSGKTIKTIQCEPQEIFGHYLKPFFCVLRRIGEHINKRRRRCTKGLSNRAGIAE
jgi:hypothetical protein